MAWFEASRDLQSANKERDDVDKVQQRRGSRGEASDDGAARTKASWWHWYHVQQSRSTRGQSALNARAVRARGLALWVTESDSELNAQTTLTLGQVTSSFTCQTQSAFPV